MLSKANAGPITRVKAYDLDVLNYPHYGWPEWKAAIRKDAHPVQQFFDEKNKVLDEAMKLMAAYQVNEQEAYHSLLWAKQDVGTSQQVAAASDLGCIMPFYRKGFTELIRDNSATGRIITSNTFFAGADFASAATTVSAASSTTSFTLTSATGFKIGDTIRVGLSTGYEFRTISNLVGAVVTVSVALSSIPVVGNSVDQVIDEAGFVGSKSAAYTTGTVAVTNGSAVVTGTGTSWLANVGPGDKILVGNISSTNRTLYTILSVDSNTQLTLTAVYAGATASGQPYTFRGVPFNRVAGLRYVKLSTRGFVFENSWTMGGS